jgi:hypothetical protein
MGSCSKKAYSNQDQAEKRGRNIEAVEGKKLWTYCCTTCGKWHLTSKRPAKRSYKCRDGKRNR